MHVIRRWSQWKAIVSQRNKISRCQLHTEVASSCEVESEGTTSESDGNPADADKTLHRKRDKKVWTFVQEVKDAEYESKKLPYMLQFGKASALKVPPHLETAVEKIKEVYSKGQNDTLKEKSKKFKNQLVSRKRPIEVDELQFHELTLHNYLVQKAQQKQKLKSEEELTDDDILVLKEKNRNKVLKTLRKHVYHHQGLAYNSHEALMYMEGFIYSNYQHMLAIFKEIHRRLPNYNPHTMLDYGSGLGSAMWAARELWPTHLYEFMNVDKSSDMNTLAQLLLNGGSEAGEPYFKDVYFRQFLPVSTERKYDIVVCDLTLLELPSMNERLTALYNLWQKTNDFLVITEHGTQAGFQTVLEARQFVLELHKSSLVKKDDRPGLVGHVFAPCPHDLPCPMMSKFVCKFSLTPNPPRTCYVVLRKGQRSDEVAYPRIVHGPHLSKKTYCVQLCQASGTVENISISKQSDRDLHKAMKHYNHGDLLPVQEMENPDQQS